MMINSSIGRATFNAWSHVVEIVTESNL